VICQKPQAGRLAGPIARERKARVIEDGSLSR